MANQLYVPGRPVTALDEACPFCLKNGMFKGEIIARGTHGYVGKVADDLLLVCPTDHLPNECWDTPFAAEMMALAGQGVRYMRGEFGWTAYNLVLNFGFVAGQRVKQGQDGKWYHPHAKVLQRVEGRNSSTYGLDACIKLLDNCPHGHSM